MVNPAVHDLGKELHLPTLPSIPLTGSQEKQDIAEQSPIKMGLTYCTIQSPLSVSVSPNHSPLSSLFMSSANEPGGRISTVSQVPALAHTEGWALVNGDILGGNK